MTWGMVFGAEHSCGGSRTDRGPSNGLHMAKNKRTPTFLGELCNLTFFLREGIFDVFLNEKLGFG